MKSNWETCNSRHTHHIHINFTTFLWKWNDFEWSKSRFLWDNLHNTVPGFATSTHFCLHRVTLVMPTRGSRANTHNNCLYVWLSEYKCLYIYNHIVMTTHTYTTVNCTGIYTCLQLYRYIQTLVYNSAIQWKNLATEISLVLDLLGLAQCLYRVSLRILNTFI